MRPKVERIVENLLANAGRHTPAGTPVLGRRPRRSRTVELLVEDAGHGVPAEFRESVFEPFQPARAGDPALAGRGCRGCHWCARFAELHGGRAWVDERSGVALRSACSFRTPRPANGADAKARC